MVPTNGVDASNAAAWIDAGAWAVGFVSALFDPGELARRDVAAIEARARALLKVVAAPPRSQSSSGESGQPSTTEPGPRSSRS